MKANEFVEKFGWVKSKAIVNLMWGGVIQYHEESVDYEDLKHLVESYELVESYGGINGARKELANLCDNLIDCAYLCQAIADVESCK